MTQLEYYSRDTDFPERQVSQTYLVDRQMRYTYLVDLLNCEIGEPDLPGRQVRDTYPVNRCGTLTW